LRRNHYETAVIINAALDDEQIEAEVVKISGIITDGGGVISETEKWGRKRLAYTINKNRLGYYAIFRYEAPVGLIAEFERLLKINEAVVRFLTIRLEKEALEYFANRKYELENSEAETTEFDGEAKEESDNVEAAGQADEAPVATPEPEAKTEEKTETAPEEPKAEAADEAPAATPEPEAKAEEKTETAPEEPKAEAADEAPAAATETEATAGETEKPAETAAEEPETGSEDVKTESDSEPGN